MGPPQFGSLVHWRASQSPSQSQSHSNCLYYATLRGEHFDKSWQSLFTVLVEYVYVLIFSLACRIVYANLSYKCVLVLHGFVILIHLQSNSNILQALVRGTMSADPTFQPPLAAVKEIVSELAHRETKIQALILSTMPLVG